MRLGVLFNDGILIRIETKGVSPEWVYEQISALLMETLQEILETKKED